MSDRLHALVNDTPSIFFQLEGVALLFNEAPLRSPYRVVSLIAQFLDVIQSDPRHILLCELVTDVHSELQDRLPDQTFFTGEFDSQLLAWSSELRSQYLLVESFYLPSNLNGLRRYTQALLSQKGALQAESYTLLKGHFEGQVDQLTRALERLSEVGFWKITHGVNALDSSTQDASVFLDLTLSTGLSKSDIANKFDGQWHWCEQESGETHDASLLSQNSIIGLASSVRRLAVVRERWRHNPTITDVYNQLEQQVTCASVLLGSLYQCDVGADLSVVSDVARLESQDNPAQIMITKGLVEVRSDNALRWHELALPYQPVYKISSENVNVIVPDYAILPANQVENVSAHMALIEGSWCQIDAPIVGKESLYWMQGGLIFALYCETLERIYAVPLRAYCLPSDVINVWRVRDECIAQPIILDLQPLNCIGEFLALPQHNEAPEREPVKVQVYRDHDGGHIVTASKFVEAVILSDKVEFYSKRFLLYQDELLMIANTTEPHQHGVFVIVGVGVVRYALYCHGVERTYVEPSEEAGQFIDESFDWVEGWLSGEGQNVRIMSEACVCAIYSKLLEAIK